MKKALSLLVILSLIATAISGWGLSTGAQAASYESIFEKDKIIDIKIELPQEQLEDMYANATQELYYRANITIDGIALNNVGIRTKGNSSLNSVARSDSNRYSYRIKFDKYEKKQSLLGLDEMVLNNMFADSSYLREYLSYEAMREAGMKAPLAVFANIYINGKLTGFYLGVEAIEDGFLRRAFGDNDGNLYKQEQGSTLLYKEGDSYASSELKVGSDREKLGLKNMIQVLNEKGDYESVIDVDSALKYIAANTVLGSYDSYNGTFAHNYYLYEHGGKFTVIPWDYNMSFGGFGQGGSGWSVSLDAPVSGTSMQSRPLINNLLSVAQYKKRYIEYVKTFADYLEKMPDRVSELAERIRPYVEADPTKFTTMERFENSIIYVEEAEKTEQGFMGGRFPEGMNPETMQEAIEIIRSAAEAGLSDELLQKLRDLGLTEEQIQQLKSMAERGGIRTGKRPEDAEPFENFTPPSKDNENNTRGNIGARGNRRIGAPGPEGAAPPEGAAENGIPGPERMMPPEEGGGNGQMRPGGGMGMGGGSIITYAEKHLANINSQLSGDSVNDISVFLNGSKISFDVPPRVENDRTLVPARAIFEALGMTVSYQDGEVIAAKDGLSIHLTIGSKIAFVNGSEKDLDTASKIIDGRTLVPLRFIGETAGLAVDYNADTNTITLEEPRAMRN